MIPLSSNLESREQEYVEVKNMLEEHQFALGGSWDYDHGSFDRSLDEAHKVWLRLPFDVINGNVDSETTDNDAKIRFGQPFVLKHVYNDGLDPTADPSTVGGLMNQFQPPLDPDGEVEPRWVNKAKEVLHQVESLFPQHG
ncbi:YugN-like family protein [Paenibacillus oenotherae]|uniref:YugN-like family protein n=1 Tax=Paenibacillus oenotherae TaxID=1435645 RepID=A0ABS7D650_9BACL|nr:YugN family protein [Paenibacillus oenotherae]MBW7474623.1 YugN-like family protein [Paenibacillus oenotherae]